MHTHHSMQINGLQCQVHLPAAPQGDGVYGLPPHHLQQVAVVDEYPACPTNWMHGSDLASSYFFPVGWGKHLWLDFNMNGSHAHHVAIVLSVQGINPITGQQSKVLRLEQYRKNCPIHTDEEFKQGRFCEKCGYKWPAQNYMTTVSTPHGLLWVDGWRVEDGKIRGFLITAETMKGIATQTIGDDRVWAIGIAFYLSKEPKPFPTDKELKTSAAYITGASSHQVYGTSKLTGADQLYQAFPISSNKMEFTGKKTHTTNGISEVQCSTATGAKKAPPEVLGTAARRKPVLRSSRQPEIKAEKLEIAAGVKLHQELAYFDHNDLSFYEEQPAGVIYANYCSVGDFEKIIAAGQRDLTKGGEGPLAGLKVGNPISS